MDEKSTRDQNLERLAAEANNLPRSIFNFDEEIIFSHTYSGFHFQRRPVRADVSVVDRSNRVNYIVLLRYEDTRQPVLGHIGRREENFAGYLNFYDNPNEDHVPFVSRSSGAREPITLRGVAKTLGVDVQLPQEYEVLKEQRKGLEQQIYGIYRERLSLYNKRRKAAPLKRQRNAIHYQMEKLLCKAIFEQAGAVIVNEWLPQRLKEFIEVDVGADYLKDRPLLTGGPNLANLWRIYKAETEQRTSGPSVSAYVGGAPGTGKRR